MSRLITTHHGSDEAKNLKIETDQVADKTPSTYRIFDPKGNHKLTTINFQVGPEFVHHHNGASDISVLAVVLDHLKSSNHDNSKTIYHLTETIKSLSFKV